MPQLSRRCLLALTAAFAMSPLWAQAADFKPYTPGMIDAALKNGETVFVDYFATWCGTCKAQDRALTELLEENPDFRKLTFIRVDWDTYKNDEVTTSRNIPRRSTLLVLKGDQELGRLVAETKKDTIRELIESGMAAGS